MTPRTRRIPAIAAPGSSNNTRVESSKPQSSIDTPEGPPRCDCRWPACPHIATWWHDLTRRADVRSGAPSDWWAMIAAGLDPVTGEPLAAEI